MAQPGKASFFKKLARTFEHRGNHHEEHHDDEGEDEHDPQLHRRTSAAANALDLAHPSQQGKLARAPPAPRAAAPEDAPPPYSAEDTGAARAAGRPQGQPQPQQQHYGQGQHWQQQQQQQQQQGYYGGPDPTAPPPTRMTSQAQNAGAQLGMFEAMATHGNVGAGIVDGAIVGNIVGQRVSQARNHAYWRQREAAYLAGDESAVMNPGVPMTGREARREERRRRRWERRRSWGM
jgi:hypothetical protein